MCIVMTAQWAETLEHERQLLKNGRHWSIIILSSEWQLDLLSEISILLSDETFKSAPKLFLPNVRTL